MSCDSYVGGLDFVADVIAAKPNGLEEREFRNGDGDQAKDPQPRSRHRLWEDEDDQRGAGHPGEVGGALVRTMPGSWTTAGNPVEPAGPPDVVEIDGGWTAGASAMTPGLSLAMGVQWKLMRRLGGQPSDRGAYMMTATPMRAMAAPMRS